MVSAFGVVKLMISGVAPFRRAAGISERDIDFALQSGIHAGDVAVFRDFSSLGHLVVMRCPKRTALPWHGFFPPKHGGLSKPEHKTGESGVLVTAAGGDAKRRWWWRCQRWR